MKLQTPASFVWMIRLICFCLLLFVLASGIVTVYSADCVPRPDNFQSPACGNQTCIPRPDDFGSPACGNQTCVPRPDNLEPPVCVSQTAGASMARIVLQATDAEADDWTVVQWEGVNGQWHDVTGWQGNFLQDNSVVWWVASGQLGQENFRWLVYDDETRTRLLITSETFDLPSQSNETVTVQSRLLTYQN